METAGSILIYSAAAMAITILGFIIRVMNSYSPYERLEILEKISTYRNVMGAISLLLLGIGATLYWTALYLQKNNKKKNNKKD